MNVYELTKEYERITELLDTIETMKADGEEGLEQFEAVTLENFAELRDNIGEKMDNIGKLICNLETEAAAKKAEAKRLTESAKRAENKVNYLKTNLIKPMLDATEGKKLHGELFAFSLRRSESVNVISTDALPNSCLIYEEVVQPDKKVIKAKLKAGETLHGAQLVENFLVQIK